MGFLAYVESKRIRLPGENIEGSKLAVAKPCCDDGDTVIPLKTLHGLRGSFAHYTNCN